MIGDRDPNIDRMAVDEAEWQLQEANEVARLKPTLKNKNAVAEKRGRLLGLALYKFREYADHAEQLRVERDHAIRVQEEMERRLSAREDSQIAAYEQACEDVMENARYGD